MALNFTDISETFEKARYLLEEESKKDQESEPFKSKYAAKELFLSLKSSLKKFQDQSDDETLFEDQSDDETPIKPRYLSATLDYYIGIICVETEELSTGEEHLNKCLEDLKGCELEPECIIIILNALNQLGILWSRRMEPKKSQSFLQQAEKFYKQYINECGKPPYTEADLFAKNVKLDKLEENFQVLDRVMTHTHYYLAQVYSTLDDSRRAAAYCHSTLKRELESKQIDPLEWSSNAATLSQIFLNSNKFTVARHHLSCAVFILEQYESHLQSTENNGDEFETKWETLKQKKADIARYWIKYAIALLFQSKEELQNQADDEDNNENCAEGTSNECEKSENTAAQDSNSTDSEIDDLDMVFQSLEVTSVEDQIPAQLILDFSQARQVFLNAQKWVNVAKEFYTLEDHASDHVQLTQDLSHLYKLLIFFEPNYDRQCKMQKRRIDLLEAILKELNPQYYLDKCRQLKYELGEIYYKLMDTKTSLLEDNETEVSSHAIQKINHLAKQSIQYFRSFLDTFLDSNGEMPETFSEETVRPILLAHFFMGRLYSKIKIADVKKELDYLTQSQHHFQFLVTYCAENESAKTEMKEELHVCQEMVKLLPLIKEKLLNKA